MKTAVLIGLVLLISFGLFSCSLGSSKDSSHYYLDWDLPYQVKTAPELEGLIEGRHDWYEKIWEISGEAIWPHKEIWATPVIKNLSQWPIASVAFQFTAKNEVTGEIFRSGVWSTNFGILPKEWLQPGEKKVLSGVRKDFNKHVIATDPTSAIADPHYQDWKGQEVTILAVKFYKLDKLPDEKKYWQELSQLDSPEKVVNYLKENYILEERESSEPYTPQELFVRKRGGVLDFAVFINYILEEVNFRAIVRMEGDKNYDSEGRERQKFNSGIWLFKYGEKIDIVVSWNEGRAWGRRGDIIFTKNGPEIIYGLESLAELIIAEEKRLNAEITELAVFHWQSVSTKFVEWERAEKYKGKVPDYYQPPS